MFTRIFTFFFVVASISLAAPSATKAQELVPIESEYYFEQNSEDCDDYVPTDVDLKRRTNGDRYQVRVAFVITEAQIAAWKCAGSHFDIQIGLKGFDPDEDFSSCDIDFVEHDYTFGADIVDTGDGTAIATLHGAKLTDDRLSPGDKYWVKVDCAELWLGDEETPTFSVNYVGAWYTIDPDGAEPTGFETDDTEINPGGLPVYVIYTGQTAELLNSDWDDEFPFED